MRTVEAEGLVGASRDEVWELYDDIAGSPRWVPSVREIVYVSGPARTGTVYRERTRMLGVPAAAQWEIVEHRRPVLQVRVATDRWMERTRRISFEARGTGTLVHESMQLRSRLPGPVGWFHELFAAFPAGWETGSAVGGAKRAFEGDPPR